MIELHGFYGQTVEIADDRLYDGEEELWVRVLDQTATADRMGGSESGSEGENASGALVQIGVTKVGVLLMGGVESTEYFVEEGDHIAKGDDLAFFETFKAVRYVVSPLAGTVVAINPVVVDDPELFDDDPYGEAWLMVLRLDADQDMDGLLLSPEDYTAALERSEHCAEGAEVLLEAKKGSPTCRAVYGGIRGNEPGEGRLSWKDAASRPNSAGDAEYDRPEDPVGDPPDVPDAGPVAGRDAE